VAIITGGTSGTGEATAHRFAQEGATVALLARREAFTRYIAGIGARHNIRVNCVRPRQILTQRLTTETGAHRFKGLFDVVQMLTEPGYPEDVANAVLFLASADARFITAEIMNIDGGPAVKI
jgi:NAD(P)-dependent dehydrogenase (short-subunit alcohol dehydrogenase family)